MYLSSTNKYIRLRNSCKAFKIDLCISQNMCSALSWNGCINTIITYLFLLDMHVLNIRRTIKKYVNGWERSRKKCGHYPTKKSWFILSSVAMHLRQNVRVTYSERILPLDASARGFHLCVFSVCSMQSSSLVSAHLTAYHHFLWLTSCALLATCVNKKLLFRERCRVMAPQGLLCFQH